MISIDTPFGIISVANEPTYSFGSADNVRSYPLEVRLTDGALTSIHGIELNGQGIMVIGAGGGCSAVHQRSALVLDNKLYLAVGDHLTCLSLELPHQLIWQTRVDIATCFGVFWNSEQGALISHGELEISRLSLHGDLLWQASGADIFSEGFRLLPDYIEMVDFNQTNYRIDYVTGESIFG